MITYSQTSHTFTLPDGRQAIAYYAGNGKWKNDPASQNVHDHGPLPQGTYTMSPQILRPHLGPAIALTPSPSNNMFGRSSFYIHGLDSRFLNDSSDGCICCGPNIRNAIDGLIKSGETTLEVTN